MSRLFPSSILGVVVVVATNQTLWDDQNRSAPHEPWGSCIEMFPLACSNSNLSIPLLPEPSWLLSTLSSSSSSQLSRRWMESKGIASPLFLTHLKSKVCSLYIEWRVSVARPINFKIIALSSNSSERERSTLVACGRAAVFQTIIMVADKVCEFTTIFFFESVLVFTRLL